MAEDQTEPRFVLFFREDLIAWREIHDMSQRQLANRAGLDPSYVSMIEAGKRSPSLAVIAKLADAMGIEVVIQLREKEPRRNHGR